MKSLKISVTGIVLGLCVLAAPFASFAALDWRIEWNATQSSHTARVYIFNPEESVQTFTLETGDVAKSDSAALDAPYLIIGQNVSLLRIAPSERKIFDILVYQDIDSAQTLSTVTNEKPTQVLSEKHQQELRILSAKYGKSKSREYPFTIMGLEPVVRPEERSGDRAIYRSKRGYWITTIIDHDHIAEQLIRVGERRESPFDSIQQAIFYYTQGNVVLTGEALAIWEEAFPELTVNISPTPTCTNCNCTYFVTVVSSNLTYYSSGHTIRVGDVLAPLDSSLAPVVAAEDFSFNISPNTQNSKRLLRVYLLTQGGRPSQQSEYASSAINHNSQIETVIRKGDGNVCGIQNRCATQDVILYLKGQVAAPTIGKALWECIATRPPDNGGCQRTCFGGCLNPTTQPTTGRQTIGMTFQNLVVLIGAVFPIGIVFRRKK